MRLEIFEYLTAIEKYGSLNKAAQSLYISQPNLSNAVKAFENEIGYNVIYRSHHGVRFTEEGKQVLLIAHNLLREKEKLNTIPSMKKSISLKVSIGNGDYALKPIYEILASQSSFDSTNITIMNYAVWEAIEKTYHQDLDLAYFIVPLSMIKDIVLYSKTHHLLFSKLKELTCQISLRKDHPLLQNFSFDGLWNYPFVDFVNQRPYAYEIYQQYINPQKIIEVDHYSLRNKLVQHSDAFSIGIVTSFSNPNIINIPTPKLKMAICEVRRNEDNDSFLFNHYRQIVEKELLTL